MSPERFKIYMLGDDVFDGQHKIIFDLSDEIIKEISERKNVSGLIHDMILFLNHHFENELKDMREFGYPYIDYHISQHNKLIASLKYLETRIITDPYTLSEITEIFVKHVDFDDRNYIEWRNQNVYHS